jgi:hypothetical protein
MRFVKKVLVLFLIAWTSVSLAQNHPSCNSQRYRVNVFDDVKVTKEVKYSSGETIGGQDVDLFMDVYEPLGDDETDRPVVVLAFGGSFINGTRGDLKALCEAFAKKGYVAVTIDYRLYDLALIPFPTSGEMRDVVIRAIKDMKSALRYLDDDAKVSNTFGVDMDWLFVGGISSGSITALHTAMLDSTDTYDSSMQSLLDSHAPIDGITNSDESIKIKAVLNYSGGLNDVSWIDSNDPPLISYHDDEDATVPYKNGYAQVFGQNIIALSGSYSIDSAATSVGILSELNTIEGSDGHVTYFLDQEQTIKVINESAAYMFNMICSETADLSDPIIYNPYSFGPNPTDSKLTINVNENASIILTDITGRFIESQSFTRSATLNLNDLTPGTYILNVQIGEKMYTEKVIKE